MRRVAVAVIAVLAAVLWWPASGMLAVPSDPPDPADPVAALAGSDARARAACRESLRAGVAVVVCDRRTRRPAKLSANGRRARRPIGARSARTLAGPPLTRREHVHVYRDYKSSRTQLTAVAVVGATLGYARFRLPTRPRLAGVLRVADRHGRPVLTLFVGRRRIAPSAARWAMPPTPLPTPTPPTQAPAPAPTATPSLLPTPGGPTAIEECGALAPADAGDAVGFDRLWHLERNGPGWTGGDGVFSVRLDDGRIAWLFGDSFIGGVLADGRRSPDWRMVRNTIVIQDGGCLTTLIRGTAQAPTALLQASDSAAWYWPQDATVDQQGLHVVALRVIRTGGGAWDFSVVGVDLVDLDLRSFTVDAVRALADDGSVLWGSSVLETDAATFVYGVENTAHDSRLYLARAGNRTLGGDWQFYRGGPEPWSSDARDAAPLPAAPEDGDEDPPPPLTGVSSAISVFTDRDGVVLISQAPGFGTEITARRAPAPEGPFQPPETIATAPPPPDVPGAFTYGARVHPDLAGDDLQLLSWNVSSFGDILFDATVYRPRFDSLTWPPTNGAGSVASGAPR